MNSPPPDGKSTVRLVKCLRVVLALSALGVTLCVILGCFGGLWWGFDLLSHFRLQYCAGFILIALLSLVMGMRKVAALSGLCVLILSGTLFPYLPFSDKPDGVSGVRILSYNVHTANSERSSVMELVQSTGAEIVVLYEVDLAWMRSISSLLGEYSIATALPREDNFGIILLSKNIELAAEVVGFGSAGVPTIVAMVRDPRFAGLLVATHPVPPVGMEGSRLRDEQIQAIADYLRKEAPPEVVVVGDLNASPWSHAFRILTAAGLRDARKGFGISPTWMRSLPWIAIPIDHALVGGSTEVLDYELLDSTGSDHNGVLVTIRRKS